MEFPMHVAIFLFSFAINHVACKQLLVLAPPSESDPTYKENFNQIVQFYVDFVNKVKSGNDVILVADKKTMPFYQEHIESSKLLQGVLHDPFIRRVSPPMPKSRIQFTYLESGSFRKAKAPQSAFDKFVKKLGIEPTRSTLLLDNANLVNDNADRVITTTRFLEDNNLDNKEAGIQRLKNLFKINHVSILTGDDLLIGRSASNMSAYVCSNTIYMQKLEEPKRSQYRSELLQGCPDCQIFEVKSFDPSSPSCGKYLNVVATDNYVYIPSFNNKEFDADALVEFQKNPCGKTVIQIDASAICQMGGSLRDFTWQTAVGEWAEKLKEAAQA